MGKKVYLSERAYSEVFEYLEGEGYEPVKVSFDPRLGEFTGDHADLRLIRLSDDIIFADEYDFRPDYPENAAFCALILGNLFIHRLDITASKLLNEAKKRGMKLIDCRQGYARCSSCVVDEGSVITADRGLADILRKNGVEVLEISPKGVLLPGYSEGFIGGASGRVGNTILFNGDLSSHPDYESIVEFIESRRLSVKYFQNLPLRDIGSIII